MTKNTFLHVLTFYDNSNQTLNISATQSQQLQRYIFDESVKCIYTVSDIYSWNENTADLKCTRIERTFRIHSFTTTNHFLFLSCQWSINLHICIFTYLHVYMLTYLHINISALTISHKRLRLRTCQFLDTLLHIYMYIAALPALGKKTSPLN